MFPATMGVGGTAKGVLPEANLINTHKPWTKFHSAKQTEAGLHSGTINIVVYHTNPH